MPRPQPSLTFRGSIEEVFSHRDEIPAGAVLALKVFVDTPDDDITLADSLADLLEEAGQIQRGEPVYPEDPIKQQVAEAVREKFKRQGFEI